VKKWIAVSLLCFFVIPCMGQIQPAICPKHIETPSYPPLPRQTRIMGEVALSVTIDAEGKVQHVTPTGGNPTQHGHQLLEDSAIENIQHWTFNKPPTAPYIELVFYDYEVDPSLPPAGGPQRLPVITKVVFDLPDHVRILTNEQIIDE
jgi:TonB family protein